MIKIHDRYTVINHREGEDVDAVLYWAARVADSIKGIGKYLAPHRELAELIWSNFRVLGAQRHAIQIDAVGALKLWCYQHIPKLSETHARDARILQAKVLSLLNEIG